MSPSETLATLARLQRELNQASADLLTAVVAVRTENLMKQPTALEEDLAFVHTTLTNAIEQAQAALITAATLYTASTTAEQPPVVIPLTNGRGN